MKHLRLYLGAIILLCVSVVGFWVYTRYLKSTDSAALTFTVQRGSLDQLVRARGKVVTQKAYDLAFGTSGTIQTLFVKEGDVVQEHQPLVQLDTRNLSHERARLGSVLTQRQSAYDKLIAGARSEQVAVYATKVQSAEAAFKDAQDALSDAQAKTKSDLTSYYEQVSDVLASASVSADDAVRQETEAFFSNDDTASPTLTFQVSQSASKSDLETDRSAMGQELKALALNASSSVNASPEMLDAALQQANTHLSRIQLFLDKLAFALNYTINLSDTTLAAYKTSVNTARTNVNTARTNITTLQQKIAVQKSANQQTLTQSQTTVNAAKNTLKLAQDELSLQTAGALAQDINSARAAMTEVQDQIASLDDQIQKSTIEAPTAGVISNIAFEVHEVVQPGVVVIHFASLGQKIESDVSELDIAQLKDDGTQTVTVKLDAFPGVELTGHIISIDTQEVLKDGDTYYRVNILLNAEDHLMIRSGMSADVTYHVSTTQNVLTIPAFTVRKQNGEQVVSVLRSGKKQIVPVKTGITDGDRIEILEGLQEGETIFSSSL